MWMTSLIILLCIQRSLTIEPENVKTRIYKDNDEARDENNSKDQSIEQYDTQEMEYEDEDLSDSPDIDGNKSSVKEGTESKKTDIMNNKINDHPLNNPQLQKIMRLARAALPFDNSSKIDEAESDMEEDEEFEDSENIGSTEEVEEAEAYDNGLPTNREKGDRSKRQTINAKKGTASSVPDLFDTGEDESLQGNYKEDYGDFSATRKEGMTVRARQRRITAKSLVSRDIIASASAGHSKGRRIKDNVRVASNCIGAKLVGTRKASCTPKLVHGKKGKASSKKKEDKIKSSTKNGGVFDFEELKKAYNNLVCAVENFMEVANKTMMSKAEDWCNSNKSSAKDSTRSTIDWCTTPTTCVTPVEDQEFDEGDFRKSGGDEESHINIKKKFKGVKMEYQDDPIDKSGAYVYNDYDSVDPNDYDSNVPVKSSSSWSTSHSKQSLTSLITDGEKSKNLSSIATDIVTTREMSATPRSSYMTTEATKDSKTTWTTFRYETKIKLRPSKRLAKKVSTDFQKIFSRRKHHFTRRKELLETSKEAATPSEITNYPVFKNAPPSHEGDTEIIEVEYI